jgi:multidrug transporter EmrE-like cation transporter
MVNFIQLGAIILAGVAVLVADVLIKKISVQGNFLLALKNPWMLGILILYAAQILFFIYIFINDWQLGIVGNIEIVIYAIGVVLIGGLLFGEHFGMIQIIGIILGLGGVVLMNWK